MRWVTYASPAVGADRPGLVREGMIHGLAEPPSVLGLLGEDPTMMGPAERALANALEVVPLDGAQLRAPVPAPPSRSTPIGTSCRCSTSPIPPPSAVPTTTSPSPRAAPSSTTSWRSQPWSGGAGRTCRPSRRSRTSPGTWSCATGARATSSSARCASSSDPPRARTRPPRSVPSWSRRTSWRHGARAAPTTWR